MAETIKLDVLAPDDRSFTEEISELYIPAYYGKAGILENHLPFIGLLSFGEVSFVDKTGNTRFLYIEGGVLENRDNHISLIVDAMMTPDELDADAIGEQLIETEALIKSAAKGDISPETLQEHIVKQKALTVKLEILDKSKLKPI